MAYGANKMRNALIALNRFGLGSGPAGIESLSGDPIGALEAELAAPGNVALNAELLLSSQKGLTKLASYRRDVDAARLQGERLRLTQAMTPYVLPPSKSSFGPSPENTNYVNEIASRLKHFRETPLGFIERLVLFWSNHFSISMRGAQLRMIAGAYEREAIRPHVLGHFGDMLKAVAQHPAMLIYLENTKSVGPSSLTGLKNRRRGLNENFAREMLELHTVGVDGGYTQVDVTALACILSGWTISAMDSDSFNGGRFTFAPADHEPGDQRVLGRMFPEDGLEQGEAIVDYLAAHPATAHHIALKLATYFVADIPAPSLVERLALRFQETRGDLGELSRVLIASPEAWVAPSSKLRTPQEFLIAASRLTGLPDEAKMAINHLNAMGQPFWNAGSPRGYPDRIADWLSPTGITMRIELADQIGRLSIEPSPLTLADAAFGGLMTPQTRATISRAESRHQGMALLLMSPEFQRR